MGNSKTSMQLTEVTFPQKVRLFLTVLVTTLEGNTLRYKFPFMYYNIVQLIKEEILSDKQILCSKVKASGLPKIF